MPDALITLTTVLAALWLMAGVLLFQRLTPGYEAHRETISELATRDAPHQWTVRLALFLPVGLLCLYPAILHFLEQNWAVAALGLALATGYLGAAAFPADPGSPLGGSLANRLHNLTGAIMYAGGGISLIAATGQAPGSLAIGVVTLIGLTGLGPNDPTGYRGYLQRTLEIFLFFAFFLHAVVP